jgi:hypothetical protein
MAALLTWIENQILKAHWSFSTSLPGVLGGLALILPELAKLFDGDPKTSPDMEKVTAGCGLMALGWNAKSASNTGLAPTMTTTAAQATVADNKATAVQAKEDNKP